MKTLNQLKEMVKERMMEENFEIIWMGLHKDCPTAYLKDKLEIVKTKKVGYNGFEYIDTEYYGLKITVDEVHRNNATQENASLYLSIYDYKQYSGSLVKRVKLYNKFSDKKLNNLITQIFEEYKNMGSGTTL